MNIQKIAAGQTVDSILWTNSVPDVDDDAPEYTTLAQAFEDMRNWRRENEGPEFDTIEIRTQAATILVQAKAIEWVAAQTATRRARWNNLASEGMPQREVEGYMGFPMHELKHAIVANGL